MLLLTASLGVERVCHASHFVSTLFVPDKFYQASKVTFARFLRRYVLTETGTQTHTPVTNRQILQNGMSASFMETR
jgi:hypothetical protein